MSNIPASKRKPTKIDFFDRLIDLRAKIIDYIGVDFGPQKEITDTGEYDPNYWKYEKLRGDIYDATKDVLYCVTQANTIWITSLYEYNERRRYMTKAIGDLEYIIQEFQYVIRSLGIKPTKYENLTNDIEEVITSIKNWRKADNKRKPELK